MADNFGGADVFLGCLDDVTQMYRKFGWEELDLSLFVIFPEPHQPPARVAMGVRILGPEFCSSLD